MTRRPNAFRAAASRRGFTLIELIVVISIIAILAALILPAIMGARKAARTAQCLNNMRNVATAMVNSQTASGKFPNSGVWDTDTTATPPLWDFIDGSSTHAPATAATDDPGFKYSWALTVLPNLERNDIFDAWDFSATSFGGYYGATGGGFPGGNAALSSTDVAVYVCPEDSSVQPGNGNLSYVVNGGLTGFYDSGADTAYGSHWFAEPDGSLVVTTAGDATQTNTQQNLFRSGVMFAATSDSTQPWNQRHSQSTIKDGLSTTVLVSENVNAGYKLIGENGIAWASNWGCPHPNNTSFVVLGDGTAGAGLAALLDDVTAATGYLYGNANPRTAGGSGINTSLDGSGEGIRPFPNSLHPGGINVAMCDASARFIDQQIDGEIWARLVTSAGSKIVKIDDGTVVYENGGTGYSQTPYQESN